MRSPSSIYTRKKLGMFWVGNLSMALTKVWSGLWNGTNNTLANLSRARNNTKPCLCRSTNMTCRVCGNLLPDQPLARYANMPSVAQNLPDEKSLSRYSGVDLNVCQCRTCGL